MLGTCGAVVAMLLMGCSGPAGVDDVPVSGAAGTTDAPDLAPYVVEPAVEIRPVEVRRPMRTPDAGAPTRLVVPALHVNAPVVPIGATDGVLVPPGDPQVLGWWRDGAVPGAAEGGALITGHTVHSGGGAFDDLETLDPGDRVTVRTVHGRIRYAVTGVTVYRKATLAEDAARVFRQTGPGRLVLITCEDWNGTGYDSNAVVFAEPV
jgi:LPXTG-site transpeptidase (sortase) family protein